MIKNVWIYVSYNLYESKVHFSKKICEAFQRKGISARVLENVPAGKIKDSRCPDLTLSFNRSIPTAPGKFFWDSNPMPHLSILLDPAVYDLNIIMSENWIISCVDKLDCDFIRMNKFKKVFFLPHAIEKEFCQEPLEEKTYEVVFLGSCYDPDNLLNIWRQTIPVKEVELILEAADLVLSDDKTAFWQATAMVLQRNGLDVKNISLSKFNRRVDNYARGVDRLNLIRSIKHAKIDVFGGTCWRAEEPVWGWSHYLSGMPNVTVHPSISYEESLQVLKRSKLCLNSMPFFKNGTHERIFGGLAAGCLPITTENVWIKENFNDGEDISIYRPKKWDDINSVVESLLANEKKRKEMVERGRAKVLNEHTWDNRVDTILKEVPPLMEIIQDHKKKKQKE